MYPYCGPQCTKDLVGEMFAMVLNAKKKKVIEVDLSSPGMLGSPAAPPSTGSTLPFQWAIAKREEGNLT